MIQILNAYDNLTTKDQNNEMIKNIEKVENRLNELSGSNQIDEKMNISNIIKQNSLEKQIDTM